MKDKEQILIKLMECAKIYDQYYKDKNFLIVYKEGNNIKYKQIAFRDRNFRHLVGIKTSRNITAKTFYYNCLNKKLSAEDIELRQDGSSIQKINVFKQLTYLMTSPSLIGNFNENGMQLRAEYFMGDTKKVLSVGFDNNNFGIPKTLLAMDIKKITNKAKKVETVFSKHINDSTYKEVTYKAKDVDLAKIIDQLSSHGISIDKNTLIEHRDETVSNQPKELPKSIMERIKYVKEVAKDQTPSGKKYYNNLDI